MYAKRRRVNRAAVETWSCWIALLLSGFVTASPPGFVKSTIPLNAPPVGLAFDSGGVLFVLEGAPFGSNEATLRAILPDGTFGNSFAVLGDDPSNFFVGGMTYDPLSDRLLITDNTADGRLYAVDKTGVRDTLAMGIAGIAGVAVRGSGEIFVSSAPFGSAGEVLHVDRTSGSATPVLGGLGFGAGLAVDLAGNLIVQDASFTPAFDLRGRLQRLPITETPSGLQFGTAAPLIEDLQSSYSLIVDSEGDIFSTGGGGLFQIDGTPLVETSFHPSQFAAAIAYDPGPFERFAGPGGGRLAFAAEAAFGIEDTFVTLLTPARPGDFNGDGHVDANDYSQWRSAFGTNDLSADGNGDGAVDAADYVIWRKGVAMPATMLSTTPAGNVPEPTTVIAALTALTTVLVMRREWQRWRPK